MTRLLFHVQNLLGIGHQRRAEMLAKAFVEAGISVRVATGGAPIPGEDWGGAELTRLPVARAPDGDFKRLVDDAGDPIDDAWRASRRAMLLACAREFCPDIVLLEGYPFARRAFAFEVEPLIERSDAGTGHKLVLCSLRDILVERAEPSRAARIIEVARSRIDRILVHGDPALIRLEASFPQASALADRIAYTGYVARPLVDPPTERQRRGVIVAAGGGAVGASLLRAAVAAYRTGAAGDQDWLLILGPNCPADLAGEIRAAAGGRLAVADFLTDYPQRLGTCALSISQAGYNTVLDALRARAPMLLVPYAAPGESEQTRRATLLVEAGRACSLPETELSGARLAAAIAAMLADPPRGELAIRTDGARVTAELVMRWASELGHDQ